MSSAASRLPFRATAAITGGALLAVCLAAALTVAEIRWLRGLLAVLLPCRITDLALVEQVQRCRHRELDDAGEPDDPDAAVNGTSGAVALARVEGVSPMAEVVPRSFVDGGAGADDLN